MTTLGRREKCLRNRSEKGQLRALRAHRCETGPSRRRWKHRGPKPPKTLQERSSGLYRSWNLRVKMEIPAKAQLRQDAADLRRMVADSELALEFSAAIRLAVQRSCGVAVTPGAQGEEPGQPLALAGGQFGRPPRGRPGLSPGSPLRRHVSRHCQTALTAAPTILATADSEWPACTSRTARRRRRSSSAALPTGLMYPA